MRKKIAILLVAVALCTMSVSALAVTPASQDSEISLADASPDPTTPDSCTHSYMLVASECSEYKKDGSDETYYVYNDLYYCLKCGDTYLETTYKF